jgi:3-deoxy-manno-octulosonate cytidylyltransferase (CMP-KDO synthetase)
MTTRLNRPRYNTTAIVIPARLASTRLPNKPLVDIVGLPMIVRVWQQAKKADIGKVIVATADAEIADVITAAGGRAVMTNPDLPSGSDRIAQALGKIDPKGKFVTIINLQGDMPTIEPEVIATCLEPLLEPAVDISTLVVKSDDDDEKADPNAVKAILEMASDGKTARAINFCRLLPKGHQGAHFHHIGVYAYRRTALETFIKLPVSAREQRDSLEQLRALDAGMRIDAALVDTFPLGVDTPADLERVRALLIKPDKSGAHSL